MLLCLRLRFLSSHFRTVSLGAHSIVFAPYDLQQFGPNLIFGAMSPFSDWKDWFPVLCVNVWRASTTLDFLAVYIL